MKRFLIPIALILFSCQQDPAPSNRLPPVSPDFKVENQSHNEGSLIPLYGQKGCGYANERGELIQEMSVGFCGDFSEGLAPVIRDGKLGYINAQGNWYVKPRLNFSLGKIIRDSLWQTDSNRLKRDLAIRGFHQGFALIQHEQGWNFIRPNGKELLSQNVDSSYGFAENWAPVKVHGVWTLIDSSGVFKSWSFQDLSLPQNGYLAFKSDGKWGLMDTLGKKIFSPQWDWLYTPSAQQVLVLQNSVFQFLSLDGHHPIRQTFDEAYPFECGRSLVRQKGFYFLIDSTGMTKGGPWSDAFPVHECRLTVRKDAFYILLDTGLHILSQQYFDKGFVMQKGYANAIQNGIHVLIDAQGKILWREH